MKKMLAMLTALLMLALPAAGTAEELFGADYLTQAIENGRRVTTNMYVENIAPDFTGEPDLDAIIADLLNAVSVTSYTQGDEKYFAMGLKQAYGEVTDLLTFGFVQEEDVTTLTSNLLGGTIAVRHDETKPLIDRLIDMFVLMGLFTEEDAQMMKSELNTMIASMPDETAMEKALEEQIAKIDFEALDYSALTDAVMPLMESIQMGEVNMQPRNCDPAQSMITLTINGEQMKTLLTCFFRFLKANPQLAEVSSIAYESVLASASAAAALEGEELPAFSEVLDQLLEEMDAEINIEGDTTVVAYLDDAGLPVLAEIKLPGEENDTADITYTRLTMNDVQAHSVVIVAENVDLTINVILKGEDVTVNFAVAEDGEMVFSVNVDYINRSAENLEAFDLVIAMTMVEQQYDFQYNEKTERYETVMLDPLTIEFGMKLVSDTVLNGVDFTSRNAFTVSVAGKDYCTFVAETASGDTGASILDGEAVRPVALSDEDFANWFVGVVNGLQTWLYTAIEALPASVLNLIMSMVM